MMVLKDLAEHSGFWDAMRYIESINIDGEKVEDICEKIHFNLIDFYALVEMMKELGAQIEIDFVADEEVLYATGSESERRSPLKRTQFIMSHLLSLETSSSVHFKELTDQILSSTDFRSINQFSKKVTSNFTGQAKKVLSFHRASETALLIERAIAHQYGLEILCRDQSVIHFFPYKVIQMDGELTLIGENHAVGECLHIEVSQISHVKERTNCSKPINSKIEFEDYIQSLSCIRESQVRLILKVDASINWEESVAYQHFGNPCMIKKGAEHMIWAASVEPSEEIFEWISNMGAAAEIIDPSAFKRLYLRYCENRLLRVG